MEKFCAALLIFGVVAALPSVPPSPSYEEVLASAVDLYNQKENPQYAFRLLELEPKADWDPSAQDIQPLKFSIKETVCLNSEKPDVNQCDFKEDGVDKDCSGFYYANQSPATVIVQCENVDQALSRITRRRWRRRIRRFFKKHGVSVAFTVARFFG
uniref:Vipericidin n=1 Tax=Salvator merianae TaxID=96440 RepID=A0A8D0DUI7_SALMN